MSELRLSPVEARVIAVLVEKSITTPQYYPMTVNAIMLAANQKTSRRPVMSLSEGEVGAALNQLEQQRLCNRDDAGGRVAKWRQRFQHQLLLKAPTQALLATLMLRGAQTAAELRANAAALNGPADNEAFDAAINDLSDRAQPLLMLLPRSPGQSVQRYAQLLCGEPEISEDEPVAAAASSGSSRMQQLEERLLVLEARVAELERRDP